jgi:sigma-B regulation protein RsbU (phosphoserine phosphatase)
VEKAALREEQQEAAEEANLLHEFTHAATSLNLSWVLTVAAEKLREVADVAGCGLFLYHSHRATLQLAERTGSGIPEANHPLLKQGLHLSSSDPLFRRLGQGVPVDLPDQNVVSKAQDELLRVFAPHAPILLPLLDHQQLVGMVALTPRGDAPPLSARQCRILGSVGRQIATAIENARLYEEAERQVEELSALHRISQATSSSLNLKEMLETVLGEVAEVMNADSGSIMLYVPEKDHLRIEASYGIPVRISRKTAVAMGEGVAGWVALHREPLLVNNLDHDPRFNLIALRPEITSAVIVPLMVKNRFLGVLSVSMNSEERRYAQRDISLMKTMGASISIAIENARSYDAEREIAQIARDALLPRLPLEISGYEIGEKYVPSHEVGGDYYHIFDVGCGKVGILVSDVSGKSVYAAMHAAMGKHFIRALSHRCATPAEVLAHANTLIARDTPPEIFITVFYGVLDVETGELTYCNAGHVPPLLVRTDHTHEELTETGMVLGLWEETPFENAHTVIHPGEVLLCYTDGVTEAKRGTDLFGYERLIAASQKHWNRPAQQMVDLIYRRTVAFCGKKTDDDLALLAIKRKK